MHPYKQRAYIRAPYIGSFEMLRKDFWKNEAKLGKSPIAEAAISRCKIRNVIKKRVMGEYCIIYRKQNRGKQSKDIDWCFYIGLN